MEEFEEKSSLLEKDNQTNIHIGCAISASDGSSPQVYVRLLVVEHRLKRVHSSSPRTEEQICLRDLRRTSLLELHLPDCIVFSSVRCRSIISLTGSSVA